jgi:hypothetical protein
MMTVTLLHKSGSVQMLFFVVSLWPDIEALTAPKFHVVTVNEPVGFGDSFAIATGSEILIADEMTVFADAICPVFRHPVLLQRTEFTSEQLCDFQRSQRVIGGAIEALKSPAAHFPEQESHGLATFGTGGRRRVLGH